MDERKIREEAIMELRDRVLAMCSGEDCAYCVGGNCTQCLENTVDYGTIYWVAAEMLEENK